MSYEIKKTSTAERLFGAATFIVLAMTAWLGLVVTEPDVVQGEHVRFVYMHPALAWTAYLAFGVTAVSSVLYLWRKTRSRFWDRLAGSSAEIGVVLTGLTLATGMLWGKPTWGVYWTWDARLTSTALLFVLFIGYLVIRRMSTDVDQRAKRSAIAALIASVDLPIVHFSVEWWTTLHQGRTLLRPSPEIHGTQLTTMLLGMLGFTMLYIWLLIKRYRLEKAEELYLQIGLASAIEARQMEASDKVGELV